MKRSALLRILLPLFITLLTGGCILKQPINIGFSAELTGTRGELGVALRDGAMLAVEEINRKGGIKGRPLNLIIKDDEGSPEKTLEVDRELVDEDVYFIIGHVTSTITGIALKQANEKRVVLFSPASASSDFSGKSDYFFRNMGANDLYALSMADHIYSINKIDRVCLIYDIANRGFTESYTSHFSKRYESLGGAVESRLEFRPGEVDYNTLAQRVKELDSRAVLIIASAVDTALILQHLARHSTKLKTFAHGWAHTEELITKGGKAVEGLEIVATFNEKSDSPSFITFKKSFEERFSRAPGFLAVYSYEAVKILALALERADLERERLPEELTKIKDFPGVLGPVTIDRYGDVLRDSYLVKVNNGEFEFIRTISPQAE